MTSGRVVVSKSPVESAQIGSIKRRTTGAHSFLLVRAVRFGAFQSSRETPGRGECD